MRREALDDARKRKDMAEGEFQSVMTRAEVESTAKERGLVIVKRQKKIICDDINEMLPQHETMSDAYAETITTSCGG